MPAFNDLSSMMDDILPVSTSERESRIEQARELMRANGLDAVLIEPGSSMIYFTAVKWGLSERLTAVLIPVSGPISYVCPAFEEHRLRSQLPENAQVRVWDEHEDPCRLIAQLLSDMGISAGTIGMEARVRFFVHDGLCRAAPNTELVSADAVVIGCREIKSSLELALMQRANDITVEAYKACIPLLREGMTQSDFGALASAAHRALGVQGGINAQFGTNTSYPHGGPADNRLREGDVVLMDGGCGVEGYRSDISRTTVFGSPSARQREVWELEQCAQRAAFSAARVGVPCEAVDAAARKVITDAGYGPGYKVPGLPHRTGHGIGLDCHECTHLVQGNTKPLAPGMCFSNEPMIAIYGEFGVRLEDCIYMTQEGAAYFSKPSPAIDQPFA